MSKKSKGGDDEDVEKSSNSNFQKKLLARDMINQTTSIQKSIEELADILDKMHKSSDSKDKKQHQVQMTTGIKYKSQLKDLQQEYSQLKKMFKT